MISNVLETQPSVTPVRPSQKQRPAPKRHGWLAALFFLAAAGGIGYFTITRIYAWPGTAAATQQAPPKKIVPVVTAPAETTDMALYLSGLGTVTAFNTVTIRSRVDGELTKVAFSEGQMVNEGDLLARIDPRQFKVQLAAAEAQLARDDATLKSAQLDLDRYNSLSGSRSISAQQVDAQVALVKQYVAALKSDRAQIDNAKLSLSYCEITAPISGRIGLRMMDQGNLVHANDPNGLAVITQLQPIGVVFTVPQDDIIRVQKQSSHGGDLPVEAYDRDFKTKLADGALTAIDNQVDPTTGTLRIKAVFPNEDNMLFPNQFVNARLLVDTKHGATVVPSAAIQRGPNSTFVYVVKSDNTVELRDVTLGPTEGDVTAIDSGIQPGDMVVTDGVDKLRPGIEVTMRDKKKGAGEAGERKEPAADETRAKGGA